MSGQANRSSAGAGTNWQLILADLALILFVVSLTALPQAQAGDTPPAPPPRTAQVDAAQALFRPLPGAPAIGPWLQAQPRDLRATLTIFATHPAGGEAAAWAAALALAGEATAAATVPVRIIIAPGPRADLYASLAYDTPQSAGEEKPAD